MKTKEETLKAAKGCSKNVSCRGCAYTNYAANCIDKLLTDLIEIIEEEQNIYIEHVENLKI